ncbi:MAG: PhzF family phenazine biosynthesis protein [Pseudomonadota bacterium]
MTGKERPYYVLDVFTKEPLKGNPLAVVLDGEGLSDEMMQAIAGEFNLSETVFVFAAEDEGNEAALRIFTPGAELPFAGHPTVGTAVLLAAIKTGDVALPTDVAIGLEEKVGLVRAGVVSLPGRRGHATFTVPQKAEQIAPAVSRVHIAEALGLNEEEIGFDRHQPGVFSAGVPFTLVPIASVDAVKRITPNELAWARAFETGPRDNAFVYARGGDNDEASFHARMFWPNAGLREDPATGGAVAALAGAIASYERLPNGTHSFWIEQGYEMGRPSDITLEIDVEDGALFAARIGGSAVIVSKGTLFI